MRIEFDAKNFIEGSQRPDEEPSYWKLLRGEEISLKKVREEGFLYEAAVDHFLLSGRASLSEDNDSVKLSPFIPGG